MSPLRTEMKTYRSNRRKLLRHHHGEFVLIQGTTIHGTFSSEMRALATGYRLLGGKSPFLIRRIERPEEEVTHFLGGAFLCRESTALP